MAEKNIDVTKQHLSWDGLSRYTIDLKNWLYPLLHKIHARIGHVEEDVYKIKMANKTTYSIQKMPSSEGVIYSLVNDATQESCGDIHFDSSVGVTVSTWDEDLNV